MEMTRRKFLSQSGVIGCSLAASPLMTPISFAATPGDARLVVIILRGAMDGLDVVQPYGDPDLAPARRRLVSGPDAGAQDLDGFFALHPGLEPLIPMWDAGELGFVHAVSTPYRDQRSHFDGQDVLEAGTNGLTSDTRDGWLNRLLQVMPGSGEQTAYAIGAGGMPVLRGAADVSNWAPDAGLRLSPQAQRLLSLITEKDPAIHAALMQAEALSAQVNADTARDAAHKKTAKFAADRLRKDARIAAFSLNGWDTHLNQSRGLLRALTQLSDTLLILKQSLRGPVWKKTVVLCMTEFGRTVRENGTGGTDHGTGGAMIMAGGAVRGGRVYGKWPGLSEADLYQRRDLMPTRDVRAYAAWAMRGVTGLSVADLEQLVFPGLDMGSDPGVLL